MVLPYYGLRMWRRGGYAKDFQQRLGCFQQLSPPHPDRKRVWLQAVSVGEVLAIGPLIQALQSDKRIEIVLTTTTSTGYTEARKRYTQQVYWIGLFPLDFYLCSRMTWQRLQADAIILTESELWPEHLHQARTHGVPAFLVNARISDNSYKRYLKIPRLARHLLQQLDYIFAASDQDRSRLIQLGANEAQIRSTGSIKFDVSMGACLNTAAQHALRKELGFATEPDKAAPFVLLGSSTWPGEEATLLRIQTHVIAQGIDCRLLLVPRHAERGAEIVDLLNTQALRWHQRSQQIPLDTAVEIYLADTTGELSYLTQIADLAFIGKSLPPNSGGQTPIEAAGLGIPILMGPHMNNFKAVTDSLIRSGAAHIVETEEMLGKWVLDLSQDRRARAVMAQAGRDWHAKNQGSSVRIAQAILAMLQ